MREFASLILHAPEHEPNCQNETVLWESCRGCRWNNSAKTHKIDRGFYAFWFPSSGASFNVQLYTQMSITPSHHRPSRRQGNIAYKSSTPFVHHVDLDRNSESQVHATGHPAQSIPERSFHPDALDSRNPRPRFQSYIHVEAACSRTRF